MQTLSLTKIDYKNSHLWVDKKVYAAFGDTCYFPPTKSISYPNSEAGLHPDLNKIVAQSPGLTLEGIPYVEIPDDSINFKELVRSNIKDSIKEYGLNPEDFLFDDWWGDMRGPVEDGLINAFKSVMDERYNEKDIMRVLELYYTPTAPNQHIRKNIIRDLKILNQFPSVIEIIMEPKGHFHPYEGYYRCTECHVRGSDMSECKCGSKPSTYEKEINGVMKTFLKIK